MREETTRKGGRVMGVEAARELVADRLRFDPLVFSFPDAESAEAFLAWAVVHNDFDTRVVFRNLDELTGWLESIADAGAKGRWHYRRANPEDFIEFPAVAVGESTLWRDELAARWKPRKSTWPNYQEVARRLWELLEIYGGRVVDIWLPNKSFPRDHALEEAVAVLRKSSSPRRVTKGKRGRAN